MIAKIKLYDLNGTRFLVFDNEVYTRHPDVDDAEDAIVVAGEQLTSGDPVSISPDDGKAYNPLSASPKIRKCGKCGKPGHIARKCPSAAVADIEEPARDPKRTEPSDTRSLRERVTEYWRDGLDAEEIGDYLPSESLPEIKAIWEDLNRRHG